jgi:Tfp pilus assembly protein PilX
MLTMIEAKNRTHRGMYSRGIALVTALTFVSIMGILVAIILTSSISNRRSAADSLRTSQSQFAAEAGLDAALFRVWHALVDDGKPTFFDYDKSLKDMGLVVGGTIKSNTNDPELDTSSGYTYQITRGKNNVSGARIEAINFSVRATGTLKDGTVRILEQSFVVKRSFFPFDFAILTNNVNCLFCHIDVKSMDALANPIPSADKPWRRSRVGALETIETRDGFDWYSEAGKIAGSVYTRGTIKAGNTWSGMRDGVSSSLRTNHRPGEKVVDSAAYTSFNPVDCSVASNCTAKQNLYYNYPSADTLGSYGGRWPDGGLPDGFPLPIADDNNNRQIDSDEWRSTVNSSASDNNADYPPGSLSGTMRTFSGAGGKAEWGGSIQEVKTDSLANGKNDLILDGNASTISITGTVFVNGDVYIRGRVKGDGSLVARGNVYVLGDIVYDCTDSQNRKDCDYGNNQTLPKFNLISGGNVMAGDVFVAQRRGRSELADNEKGYQRSFSSCQGKTTNGYKGRSDEGATETCGDTNTMIEPNLPMREAVTFNRGEMEKAANNPNYIPRFYRFYKDDDRDGKEDKGVWVARGCGESSSDYNKYDYAEGEFLVENCKAGGTTKLSDAQMKAILQRAVITDVESDRFNRRDIRNLWQQSIYASGRPAGTFRTDGLLYSANGVFGAQQQRGDTYGQWDMRGALIAADTGILSPGRSTDAFGFRIYHDARMRPRLPQENVLTVGRGIWKVKSQ